jgi:four helix bundle protein
MAKYNIIQEKSFKFAKDIVFLSKNLIEVKKEYVLSKQILKSGTSIGANVEEAIGGVSPKDFVSKFSISYKEARETKYWIKLLKECSYINTLEAKILEDKCEEILKILATIIMNNKEPKQKL